MAIDFLPQSSLSLNVQAARQANRCSENTDPCVCFKPYDYRKTHLAWIMSSYGLTLQPRFPETGDMLLQAQFLDSLLWSVSLLILSRYLLLASHQGQSSDIFSFNFHHPGISSITSLLHCSFTCLPFLYSELLEGRDHVLFIFISFVLGILPGMQQATSKFLINIKKVYLGDSTAEMFLNKGRTNQYYTKLNI